MTDAHELTSGQGPMCCVQEEMEVSGLALHMQTKVPLLMITIQILKCQKPSQGKGHVLSSSNYLSTQLAVCSVLTQHTMTMARTKKLLLWKVEHPKRRITVAFEKGFEHTPEGHKHVMLFDTTKALMIFVNQLGPTKFINIDNRKK